MRGLATHCWFGEMQRGLWQRNARRQAAVGLREVPELRRGPSHAMSVYWRMDPSVSSRLELLQAVLRKSEQGLARQRQLIEDLRCDGYGTIEAEEVLLRFETAYQALLTKLNALRGEGVTG
jgi:hypothetical protein